MNRFYMVLIICLFCFKFVSPLSAVVNVPEKYVNVDAGERLYFEINVKYPENPKRKDLRLTYEVLDSEGETISQSKALKAVETQASFVDFLVIPEDTKTGFYIISVKIEDYELLSEEVSSSFNVKGGGVSQIQVYFFVLLGAIMFVGSLVVVNIRSLRKKKG